MNLGKRIKLFLLIFIKKNIYSFIKNPYFAILLIYQSTETI